MNYGMPKRALFLGLSGVMILYCGTRGDLSSIRRFTDNRRSSDGAFNRYRKVL